MVHAVCVHGCIKKGGSFKMNSCLIQDALVQTERGIFPLVVPDFIRPILKKIVKEMKTQLALFFCDEHIKSISSISL